MRRLGQWVAVAGLMVGAGVSAQDVQVPTLKRGTSIVLVPVAVRTKTGEPVFTLQASDFVVTDDGVPQTVRLEEDTDTEPIALVVVAERPANYSALASFANNR